MKRLALLLMFAATGVFAAAQEAPKDPQEASKPAEAAKDDAKKDDAKPADPAPAPDKEKMFEGTIDLGARWVSDVRGDMDTYRSVVNLGSGPRVVNVDLKFNPPEFEHKVADSILLQAHSWGDPYNSMRLDMQRNRIYRFTGTYSNISYFNYLPSYADPTMLTTGVFMNQRAYDTKTRNFDNELLLLPGYWLQPYIGYSRNTDAGFGISTLVDGSNNQYPVMNNTHWGQHTLRGGVRVGLKTVNLTFEQGTNIFKDDQGVYSNGFSLGDRTTSYLGQPLYMTNGWQAYFVRGDGYYSKGYGTFSPTPWLDVYGQVYHSAPNVTSSLSQLLEGNVATTTPYLGFFSSAFDQIYGNASMPRTSYSISSEVRFLNRFRIRPSIESDSYHNDNSSTLSRLFYLSSGLAASMDAPFTGQLDVHQHRFQTEGLVDVTKQLTLRGGYRYEWGYADVPSGVLSVTTPNERGELKRYVALAGVQYRPAQRLLFSADMEKSDGVKTFYRTGLQDYLKLRTQARFTLPQNLFLNLSVNYLDNSNPQSGLQSTYKSAVESASLQWLPKNHVFSLIADYTHSEIQSDVAYIVIFPFNDQNRSLYVDNATAASMMAELTLPVKGAVKPKFSFGGSFVTTAGSRPSRYYQPQGKLLLPLTSHVQLYSEWQWYGLNQPFYMYEGFRAHTIMTGVRFLM